MTETERTMYSIMNALSDLPIIFKGSMVTSLILNEHGFDSFHRETVDIDANWVGTPEDMATLLDLLNQALSPLDIHVKAFREYGPKQSAGFKFYMHDDLITKMDMDVGRKIAGKQTFSVFEYSFNGITPDQILTDKLCAISSEKVFRRMKGILDLYALSSCCVFRINDIYAIKDQIGRQMGDFSAFLTRKDKIAHAYEKMTRIDHKPDFDDLYLMVRDIVLPLSRNEHDLVWDKNGWEPDEAGNVSCDENSVPYDR